MSLISRKRKREDDALQELAYLADNNPQFRRRVEEIITSSSRSASLNDETSPIIAQLISQQTASSREPSSLESLPQEIRDQIYGYFGVSSHTRQLIIAPGTMWRELVEDFPLQTVPMRHQFRVGDCPFMIDNNVCEEADERRNVDTKAIHALKQVSRTVHDDLKSLLFTDSALSIVVPNGIDLGQDAEILEACIQLPVPILKYIEAVTIMFKNNCGKVARGVELLEDINSFLWFLEGKMPRLKRLMIEMPERWWDDVRTEVDMTQVTGCIINASIMRAGRDLAQAIMKHINAGLAEVTIFDMTVSTLELDTMPESRTEIEKAQRKSFEQVLPDHMVHAVREWVVLGEELFVDMFPFYDGERTLQMQFSNGDESDDDDEQGNVGLVGREQDTEHHGPEEPVPATRRSARAVRQFSL